jgi:hypothetical protein
LEFDASLTRLRHNSLRKSRYGAAATATAVLTYLRMYSPNSTKPVLDRWMIDVDRRGSGKKAVNAHVTTGVAHGALCQLTRHSDLRRIFHSLRSGEPKISVTVYIPSRCVPSRDRGVAYRKLKPSGSPAEQSTLLGVVRPPKYPNVLRVVKPRPGLKRGKSQASMSTARQPTLFGTATLQSSASTFNVQRPL